MSRVEVALAVALIRRKRSKTTSFFIRAIIKQTPGPMPPMLRVVGAGGIDVVVLELYLYVRTQSRDWVGGCRRCVLIRIAYPEAGCGHFKRDILGMFVGQNKVQFRTCARVARARGSVVIVDETIPIEIHTDLGHRAGEATAKVEDFEVRQARA